MFFSVCSSSFSDLLLSNTSGDLVVVVVVTWGRLLSNIKGDLVVVVTQNRAR
jgi:hypothetical protein